MRKQLFDGLTAGQVSDAMDLATLPDHPAVEYRDTPATLDNLAKVLGIDQLPSPPLSIPKISSGLEIVAVREIISHSCAFGEPVQ